MSMQPPTTLALEDPEAEEPPGIPRIVSSDPSFGPLPILPLRRGDLVGRFEIERRLGTGGMGVVYSARDLELGRRVAVKLVRHRAGERPDPRFTARLRREAQALARLSHPNVVGLFDLGSTARGIFLAMEFIDGPNVAKWLTLAPRTWWEILDVFVQAGRGLAAAHAAGLIHRDVKPNNVIVGPGDRVIVVDFGLARATSRPPDDADSSLSLTLLAQRLTRTNVIVGPGDRVIVVDFGLARATSRPPDDADSSLSLTLLAQRLTRTNVILGTKGYMAPEQLLGLAVGPSCDQFSFCVALWEALYGARPYPGENAMETARSFADRRLVEPADRRGVPVHVHRALRRGLSVEPEDRFADMTDLLCALMPRPRRGWRRWGLLAAILATASASAGTTVLLQRAGQDPEPVCDAPGERIAPSGEASSDRTPP
jgi:serine/threonine protein kinase